MLLIVPVMFLAYCGGNYLGGPFWGVGAGLSSLVMFVFVLLVARRV